MFEALSAGVWWINLAKSKGSAVVCNLAKDKETALQIRYSIIRMIGNETDS
jgi:hypothetical protein